MNIDNDLYYAAMYAKELEDEGKAPGLANWIAGNKYFYTARAVAKARSYLRRYMIGATRKNI